MNMPSQRGRMVKVQMLMALCSKLPELPPDGSRTCTDHQLCVQSPPRWSPQARGTFQHLPGKGIPCLLLLWSRSFYHKDQAKVLQQPVSKRAGHVSCPGNHLTSQGELEYLPPNGGYEASQPLQHRHSCSTGVPASPRSQATTEGPAEPTMVEYQMI